MKTYTYTARNINNPEKVLTFTLQGEYLKVNLTGLEENLTDIISKKEDPNQLKSDLLRQAGPAAIKIMEKVSGPVHISDVQVDLGETDEKKFQITFWKRLAGLRAAPVVLDMGKVDNPQAAKRFSEELRARKESSGKINKFFGPLDYWLGWIGLAVLLLITVRNPSNAKST